MYLIKKLKYSIETKKTKLNIKFTLKKVQMQQVFILYHNKSLKNVIHVRVDPKEQLFV